MTASKPRRPSISAKRTGGHQVPDPQTLAAIRAEYRAYDREHGAKPLSRRFGISRHKVARIAAGKSWGDQ